MSFPFSHSITAPDTDLYALRKNFPSFVKDSKGSERGGLNIQLDLNNRTITIRATKQSFINVALHKINTFAKSHKTITTQVNTPSIPDDKIRVFNVTLPIKNGHYRVNGAGGSVHSTHPDTNLHRQAIKDVLSWHKPNHTPVHITTKTIPHKWTDLSKVTTGTGLITPPSPPKSPTTFIVSKQKNTITHSEQTDEDGNIINLQDYLHHQTLLDTDEVADNDMAYHVSQELDGWDL